MNTLKSTFLRFGLIFLVCTTQGCGHIKEFARTIWGSSTRALEEARVTAARQTYRCPFEDCFEAVLAVAQEEELVVFQKNRFKEYIVLMGIPNSVDTTEVGVFFSSYGDKTRIDISSLSTPAKDTAARILFSALEEQFPTVTEVDLNQK